MIASLAMYDFGPAVAANDRLWAGIRDGLRADGAAAPEGLTRGVEAFWPAWEDRDLVLSQTCGLPFRMKLHDRVTYVATPDYGVEGCPPGHYRSLFVARKEDPRQEIAAFGGAAFAFFAVLISVIAPKKSAVSKPTVPNMSPGLNPTAPSSFNGKFPPALSLTTCCAVIQVHGEI
ncbi:MAG: hypothetical protein HC844_20340 [Tabrizicola sp.]|nr:hypothetical protein [Tabrizicola sp.]